MKKIFDNTIPYVIVNKIHKLFQRFRFKDILAEKQRLTQNFQTFRQSQSVI